MVVLALSGWKGAGKDTVADYLVARYGFIRLSFAAKLKDLVAQSYNIARDYLDRTDLKETALPQYLVTEATRKHLTQCYPELLNQFPVVAGQQYWTPRTLCIFMGQTMRLVEPDYWIKLALTDLDSTKNYVLTDLRFANEVVKLRELQAILVRLHRQHSIYPVDFSDVSEHALDRAQFDYHLTNDSDFTDLYRQVDDLVARVV